MNGFLVNDDEIKDVEPTPTWVVALRIIACVILLVGSAWFAYEIVMQYFVLNDWNGILPDLTGKENDAKINTIIMGIHMSFGVLTMLLGPIQIMFKNCFPTHIHRIVGTINSIAALITGWFGVVYCLLNTTTGGLWMRIWFGLYGVCIVSAAIGTMITGFSQNQNHAKWASRMCVLGTGSFWYRIMYLVAFALGYTVDCSTLQLCHDSFARPLDRAFDVLFFVPGIVILEIVFLASRRPLAEVTQNADSPQHLTNTVFT